MYNKEARREKYLRLKNGEKKHCCIEEKQAYQKIRYKWGFNDIKIHKLLQEYTVKEIFYGSYENGIFKPKNLIKLFLIILVVSSIFCGYDTKATDRGIISQNGEIDIEDIFNK